MQILPSGQYFGHEKRTGTLGSITFAETDYTFPFVDWHAHERPYFTFILQGHLWEGGRQRSYDLEAGAMLFHYQDTPHQNRLCQQATRGFHLDIDLKWFTQFDVHLSNFGGIHWIRNPKIRLAMEQVYLQSFDPETAAMDTALVDLFNTLNEPAIIKADRIKPKWVKLVQEAIEASDEFIPLSDLALLANLHPVYLCRQFSTYFGMSLSCYQRSLRLLNALSIYRNAHYSWSQIAHQAGFSDQSHFNRVFRATFGCTPTVYAHSCNQG